MARQFLGSRVSVGIYNEKTVVDVPAIVVTDKLTPAPMDSGTKYASLINTFIRSGYIATFEYRNEWYVAKRISIANGQFYAVKYDDFTGVEHVAYIMRKLRPFQLYES